MNQDKIKLQDAAVAGIIASGMTADKFSTPRARATSVCMRVKPEHKARADALVTGLRRRRRFLFGLGTKRLERELAALPRYQAWVDVSNNVVTTQGRNSVLDVYLRAQAQITTWYVGLISSVSYTAVAAGDTAAQINGANGWREAGAANAPTYSGVRKTLAWSAASGGSITTSAAAAFTFTGSGTVRGCFVTSASAIDATTGTLYNAVLFSAPGDRTVVSSDVVNVSITFTA